jgi:hypothetical protein
VAALAAAVAAFGAVDGAGAAQSSDPGTVELAQAELRVTVPSPVVAEPASRRPLPVSIGPGEAPRHSYLRVRGLPPAVALSEGYIIAPGVWAVPLNTLGNLQMNVPTGLAGDSELTVSLVSEGGALLGETKTTLVIRAAASAAPKAAPPPPPVSAERRSAPDGRATGTTAPVLTPEDRERAERYVARGERDLLDGNIALARQFFLRAAEAGLARGAFLLATTYDPRELARLHAQGIQPNLAEARTWYERAHALGAAEAAEKLAGLPGR